MRRGLFLSHFWVIGRNIPVPHNRDRSSGHWDVHKSERSIIHHQSVLNLFRLSDLLSGYHLVCLDISVSLLMRYPDVNLHKAVFAFSTHHCLESCHLCSYSLFSFWWVENSIFCCFFELRLYTLRVHPCTTLENFCVQICTLPITIRQIKCVKLCRPLKNTKGCNDLFCRYVTT